MQNTTPYEAPSRFELATGLGVGMVIGWALLGLCTPGGLGGLA